MLVPPSPFKGRKSLAKRAPALLSSSKSLTEQQARQQILDIVTRLKVSLESFSFDKNEHQYDTLRRLSKELITDVWSNPRSPASFADRLKETEKYLNWLSQQVGVMKRDWSKTKPDKKVQLYRGVSPNDFYEMGESIRTANQKIARIAMQYKLSSNAPDWRPGHTLPEDYYTMSLPERTDWSFGPSRFQQKKMALGYKCQTGVNKGKPGRCPGPQKGKNPPQEGASEGSRRDEKPKRGKRASRGEMVEARRIGDDPKTAEIVLSNGKPVPSHIKPAMIPPKWTDVKISMDPNSDVLVTGRDTKGRTKTIYSQNHHMKKAAAKFSKIREMLKYRETMQKQIQQGVNDPNTKEAATCLWLIEQQGTRPGSERDTKADKQAYGATTLQARHIVPTKEGGGAMIAFVGKEGILQKHVIQDPNLAKELLRRKQEVKNPRDKIFNVSDNQLRDYAKTLGKGGFTPKDFRTLKGTSLAIKLIQGAEKPPDNEKEYKKRVKGVATVVSKVLGNTPAMALSAYIDPTVWSSWRVLENA